MRHRRFELCSLTPDAPHTYIGPTTQHTVECQRGGVICILGVVCKHLDGRLILEMSHQGDTSTDAAALNPSQWRRRSHAPPQTDHNAPLPGLTSCALVPFSNQAFLPWLLTVFCIWASAPGIFLAAHMHSNCKVSSLAPAYSCCTDTADPSSARYDSTTIKVLCGARGLVRSARTVARSFHPLSHGYELTLERRTTFVHRQR